MRSRARCGRLVPAPEPSALSPAGTRGRSSTPSGQGPGLCELSLGPETRRLLICAGVRPTAALMEKRSTVAGGNPRLSSGGHQAIIARRPPRTHQEAPGPSGGPAPVRLPVPTGSQRSRTAPGLTLRGEGGFRVARGHCPFRWWLRSTPAEVGPVPSHRRTREALAASAHPSLSTSRGTCS